MVDKYSSSVVDYERPLDDLIANTAHNAQIKKFAIASLLAAALFIGASAFIYAQTTISYRHTVSLLNDTFRLHDILLRINQQIEFLFNSYEEQEVDPGFLNNFKTGLKSELNEAQKLDGQINRVALIKQREYITPVQNVVQRDLFDKGVSMTFQSFYSMVDHFIEADPKGLVGGITTWRHNVTLNKMRITTQYSELLGNLINSSKKELALYNTIQVGILVLVSGVLIFLWLGVYLPLIRQLRHQHLNAIESYYDVHAKSRQDELTKLANRLGFNETITTLLNTSLRPKFTLLNFDIDSFKEINDQYGHSAGDEALVQFAEHLTKVFQKSICTARLGGDEFAVITDKIKPENIDGIIAELSAPIPVKIGDSEHIFIRASVGVASYGIDGIDRKTLLRNADRSLYQHKNVNKISRARAKGPNVPSDELSRSIDFGLKNSEFHTVFQPIVNAKGQLAGLESLVRWNNPKYKNVSISLLFEAAENSGAAEIITTRVLEDTIDEFEQLKHEDLAALNFNINVLGKMDTVCRSLTIILNTIKNYPDFGRALVIELAESVDFEGANTAFNGLIARLELLGVRFAFDDFGTGHSALVKLLSAPIHQIKIDGKLITDIANPKTKHIVKSIVDLSEYLDLEVIAEGVESAEQFANMKLTKCHFLQGNYVCKPLPSEFLFDWVIQNSVNTGSYLQET